MKKLILLVVFAFPLTLSAHDSEDRDGGGHSGRRHHHFLLPPILLESQGPKKGPCADVNLDAGQKSKLRDAYFKFAESEIDLKSEVKKARLNKFKVSVDPKTSYKAVQEASSILVEKQTKLMSAKETFKNQVHFELLKPDQREAYWRCEHFPRFRGPEGRHGHHPPEKMAENDRDDEQSEQP